jgi:hypothetical protein
MKQWRGAFAFAMLVLALASAGFAEEYDLQYFLGKTSSQTKGLSNKEKAELLSRLSETVERAQRIQKNLAYTIQSGKVEIPYQEGEFWMSKLEADQRAIESAKEQLKLLEERPTHLVASVTLYKCLKDLSANFNAYNNTSSFSASVGDLAPEIELWADPVFYRLYLLPLAQSKDIEPKRPKKEPKSSVPKGKKP